MGIRISALWLAVLAATSLAGCQRDWCACVRARRTARGACLLLLVSLLAAGCRRQADLHAYDQAPLKALEKYAPVYKRDENGRVVDLKLENKQLDDEAFDQLGKLTALHTLSLYGSSVTDGNLAKLQAIGQLKAIGLGATAITDEGLSSLKELPNLRWLWLNGDDGVTSPGVEALKEALPDLVVYQ